MVWRATLVSGLVGVVLSLFSGVIVFMLGWLGSIPVSIWALKVALSKKHGGCSIILVKSPDEKQLME
ncbi:MAG: hypothetical protein M2R45_03507 [Verrucomicrobia subdivision 3 bacterium]|nr:hypothetical protein [Limisphaerales bacterium]MCS1415903.1 hypothetical protein [Limisphaerales bacterium]